MPLEWYSEFVDLNYRPKPTDLVCIFRVRPAAGFDIVEAAGRIASESSCGTWTTIGTMKPRIRRLMARAFYMERDCIHIAYPDALFEAGNLPQVFSAIAGNIFGMKAVARLRLEDVHWPPHLIQTFRGPQYGIAGVRRLLRIHGRPLTATVPKPKVGLSAREHAAIGYEAWLGGIDLLKDDENLTSLSFNKFAARVSECFRVRAKAEANTGERKSYLVNVTAETKEMLRRARLVHDHGGEYVMIDFLTVGWAGLQTLREECADLRLAIHAHRAFHSTFTRLRDHGVSLDVLAAAARLIGVDQLHVGTGVGKLESPRAEVERLVRTLTRRRVEADKRWLPQEWGNVKPVLPVTSGGLHPGLIPKVLSFLGPDVVVQVGGGLWGHPRGARAGAAAVRQAVDALVQGKELEEQARHHSELAAALERWGTATYR
jgi:ribulose-bisphosphate carboxylase large chain